MIVCTLHWYFRQIHLESVADRMRVLGPPVLRGFHDEAFGAVMLFEGTRRILAAYHLGLTPANRSSTLATRPGSAGAGKACGSRSRAGVRAG